MTSHLATHAYQCIFGTLLGFGTEAEDKELQYTIFLKDTANEMDNLANSSASGNKGQKTHTVWTRNKIFD